MVIYYRLSQETKYIHLFTISELDEDGYAIVEKSIFEFAVDKPNKKRMFPLTGKKTFIGSTKGYEPEACRQFLIEEAFIGGFDLANGTIYRNEL